MRDSRLKRWLVSGYFSAQELRAGLRGMVGQPSWQPECLDYEAYWRHRGAGAIHPRFEIIATRLDPGQSVLDVGCGDGAMLEYFGRVKAIRGRGIDISATAVEQARARGVDAQVATLEDLQRESPSPSFDHVVMSEVLEHVQDPENFVRRGWDVARQSLWLTFPNIAYFSHRLRLAAGKFPVQWVVFPGEHLRFWSVTDFRQWLRRLGLPEAQIYPSNGVTVFGLHRLWPNLFANQIVVRLDRSAA
jgi:methionine biosynthesis protein MetW